MSGKDTAAAIVGVATLLLSPWASAQPSAEPVRVAYEAPAGCPNDAAFFDGIASRTPKIRRAAPGEEARTLRVRVTREGATFAGSLTFEERGAGTTPRTVDGTACDQVVSALGLIAALAIDPTARTEARPTGPTGPAAPPAAASPSAAPTATAPPTPSTATTPSAAPPAPPSATAPSAAAAITPPTARSWRWGAGAHVVASSLLEVMPLLRAHVAVEREGGPWAPAARLSFARSAGMRLETSGLGALLTLSVVRAEGCPLALRGNAAGTLLLRPCAALDLGWLEGEGRRVSSPRSRTRPWAAGAALARLGWAATRWLTLEAQVAGVVPFFRESFVLDAGTEVYRAPALGAEGGLGFSLQIP